MVNKVVFERLRLVEVDGLRLQLKYVEQVHLVAHLGEQTQVNENPSPGSPDASRTWRIWWFDSCRRVQMLHVLVARQHQTHQTVGQVVFEHCLVTFRMQIEQAERLQHQTKQMLQFKKYKLVSTKINTIKTLLLD